MVEQPIFIVIAMVCVSLAVALPTAALYWLWRWLRWRWEEAGSDRAGKRFAIVLAGALAVCSPYLLFKMYELRFVLSRVPEPLQVSWIEYRLEEAWGIGLPGDNETGFVVYRLTGSSAQWARKQGRDLGKALHGEKWVRWQPTPVKDRAEDEQRWHTDADYSVGRAHRASLNEYLQHYGFSIPLEKGTDQEFNDAIRQPGSFYSYGRGGSVTVVDPRRGKVYFAYAG